MLRGIRKASANWLGRAVMGGVMGLLILSFAIWGINDIFRGFGRSTLASIGHVEIPIDQFQQTYNQRLQQIGRQLGHPLTAEQAKAFGLDRQVLSDMVAEAGLDQRARQMGLGISNAEIVRQITSDPTFRTPSGQFDRLRFEDVLRNAGYTEQRFMAEQRRAMLRRQIVGSLSGDIPVPKAWIAAIDEFQNQERTIQYVTLGPAQTGNIPPPSAPELSKYFDARKILFRAPEYRKIATVQVTPTQLTTWMEISDADIKAAYEKDRSRYVTPERRHVEEIVFPTMREAEAADARIRGGVSFAALAASRGLKPQDIDLGTVPKSGLVDPVVANATFALKEGEVSPPVKGRFGTVILTVLKIVPGETKSLVEVAPQIRKEIAAQRAKAEVNDLHDKIEDERAGGATLEEAAHKLKLPVVTYDVDRSGRGPSGKLISSLPDAGNVISAAFASDVGVDNDPIEAAGGYIWYDVEGVTPARDRTLDEVKSKVEERWRQDEIETRLRAKAADLVAKLKAGKGLDALAKTDDLTVQTADKLKRGKATATVSAKVIDAVFHIAKGSFGSVSGDKPGQWIVFRVTAVSTPTLAASSPEAKRIHEAVQRQLSNDVLSQYVAWLENDLGTRINQRALAQAVGNGAPDTD